MEYALSYVMMLAETFSLFLLGDSMFRPKRASRWVRGIILLLTPIFNIFLFLFVFSRSAAMAKFLFSLLLFSFALHLCYRASWKASILLSAIFHACLYVIDDCIMLLSMSLFQYSYPELISDKAAYLCGALASKLIEMTICLLFGRFRRARENRGAPLSPASWIFLLLTPVFSLMIDISIITHAVATNDVGAWAILITIGLLLCNVAVMFLWEQLNEEQQALMEKELLLQSAQSDREKAAALSAAYRQQRSQTHDFQSHMQAIAALLSAGEFGRAQQYAQNWAKGAPHPSDLLISTNNALVDLLLGQKFAAAQEQGIAFHLLADDLAQLPMPDADFVAVLSNLADNAIEAAARCAGEKAIHIKLQRSPNGEFILSVRNTSPPVSIVDGAIQTNKPDTLAHGFGLENAKRILAQNGGESVLFQKDSWVQFTAKITNYAE